MSILNKNNPYDIIGIGSPFMDLILPISDDELSYVSGAKGGMEAIDYNSLLQIIQKIKGPVKIIAGGSTANTIRGLANFGRHCALIGKIGKDPTAQHFLKSIESLNITPLFTSTETPTGQVICLITPDGERTMRSFLGSGREMKAKDLNPQAFTGVSLVHIEGYTLFNESLTERAMELAKAAGAKISFDLGSFEITNVYKKEIIHLLTKYVDIVFANATETHSLTLQDPKKGCEILQSLCEVAVVLLGPEGCLVGKGNQQIKCSAFPVKPLDTTGAGDLFASGFLHGYLSGMSLQECARYGAITANAVVQIQGVEIPKDAWEHIKKRIKDNSL